MLSQLLERLLRNKIFCASMYHPTIFFPQTENSIFKTDCSSDHYLQQVIKLSITNQRMAYIYIFLTECNLMDTSPSTYPELILKPLHRELAPFGHRPVFVNKVSLEHSYAHGSSPSTKAKLSNSTPIWTFSDKRFANLCSGSNCHFTGSIDT